MIFRADRTNTDPSRLISDREQHSVQLSIQLSADKQRC